MWINRYRRKFWPKSAPADVSSEQQLPERIAAALSRSASPWEQTFLASISDQLKKKGSLSVNQLGTFRKIEQQLASGSVDQAAFAATFTEDMREKYRIACEYYAQGPYYGNAISEYRAAVAAGTFSAFVPGKRIFETLTENKYFVKVFDAWTKAGKFSCGDLVLVKKIMLRGQARTVYGPDQFLAIVLKANAAVPCSAAIGCKTYSISFLSSGQTALTEERFMSRQK